jgi:hypothetical protein
LLLALAIAFLCVQQRMNRMTIASPPPPAKP